MRSRKDIKELSEENKRLRKLLTKALNEVVRLNKVITLSNSKRKVKR